MGKKPKIISGKLEDKKINDICALFETGEENEDIRTLFKQEEDYYKPKRISNFWKNIYNEYESNGDKNRNLSLDEYLNKIEHYLRNIIMDLQNSVARKIQLAIVINFIFSKYAEEERVMHSISGSIKFTTYSDANKFVDKSLHSRYHENLETSMKRSDFIFNSVQLINYKCHKVNLNVLVHILIF